MQAIEDAKYFNQHVPKDQSFESYFHNVHRPLPFRGGGVRPLIDPNLVAFCHKVSKISLRLLLKLRQLTKLRYVKTQLFIKLFLQGFHAFESQSTGCFELGQQSQQTLIGSKFLYLAWQRHRLRLLRQRKFHDSRTRQTTTFPKYLMKIKETQNQTIQLTSNGEILTPRTVPANILKKQSPCLFLWILKGAIAVVFVLCQQFNLVGQATICNKINDKV